MYEAACMTRWRQKRRALILYFSIIISLFIDNFSDFSFGVHIDSHGEVPFTSFYNLDVYNLDLRTKEGLCSADALTL